MTSAVVLAGGSVKDEPSLWFTRQYYKFFYGEDYLWGKYKPLKKIKLKHNGSLKRRPMCDAVIENVSKSESIDDVVVVGEVERLEAMLDKNKYKADVKYVQQVGGIVENALEGYEHTEAAKVNTGVLFVPCDIPKAEPKDYDSFVNQCIPLRGYYDIFYAIIGKENLKGKSKVFRRPYLWLVDDLFKSEDPFEIKQGLFNKGVDALVNNYASLTGKLHLYFNSETKRRGLRLSNMAFGNPRKIENLDNINWLYSVRKLKEPTTILAAINETFPEAVAYFRGRLTISDMNKRLSDFLMTNFKLIEVSSAATSIDIDSEEDYADNIEYWTN